MKRLLNIIERAVFAYELEVQSNVEHRAHCRRIDERMAKVREIEGAKAGTFSVEGPVRTASEINYTHKPMLPSPEMDDLSAEVGSLQAGLATLRESLRAALPNGSAGGEK